MQRLIDADALATAIYEWMPKDQETWMESDIPPIENLVVSIMMTIEEQPTVDAVPVKHGKWIPHEDEDGEHYGDKCSECGEWYVMPYGKTNFCPNCGTRMDKE